MNSCVSLLDLGAGEAGTVVDCNGGHGLVSRFAAMGFTPGSLITVINNHRRGPILVYVHGSRVALGRGEAAKVLVRPEGDENGA